MEIIFSKRFGYVFFMKRENSLNENILNFFLKRRNFQFRGICARRTEMDLGKFTMELLIELLLQICMHLSRKANLKQDKSSYKQIPSNKLYIRRGKGVQQKKHKSLRLKQIGRSCFFCIYFSYCIYLFFALLFLLNSIVNKTAFIYNILYDFYVKYSIFRLL